MIEEGTMVTVLLVGVIALLGSNTCAEIIRVSRAVRLDKVVLLNEFIREWERVYTRHRAAELAPYDVMMMEQLKGTGEDSALVDSMLSELRLLAIKVHVIVGDIAGSIVDTAYHRLRCDLLDTGAITRTALDPVVNFAKYRLGWRGRFRRLRW